MSTADKTASQTPGDEQSEPLDLQVEITDAGPCMKHVRVVVARQSIDDAYATAVEEYAETADVPGFRAGRAPKGLVQKRFKDELQDQVRRQLIVASLEQISEDNELDPINEPDFDVQAIEIPDEGDFEYEFNIEVRPKFELPDYSGLRIERPDFEVTEQDVDAYLERYLAQYGKLVPHEGPAAVGDFATLSARFLRDGELLYEIDEFTARLRPVLRFQDAELEGFDALFNGERIGAKKTTGVTVSSEAATVEMRGEAVEVAFELLDLKRIEMPERNNAFFERIGFEDETELRETIVNSLERQALYRERQHARSQVLSKITESADWDLPESLVRRQVDNALRREMLEMQQAGFNMADIRARENELRQNAISSTEQALKEHFVLDRIAEQEKIEVTELDLDQEILLMARQQGESPRRVRSRLNKSGMIENLEAQLRERHAIDFILDKAEFVTVPAPAEEPIDRVEAVPHSVCSWSGESDRFEDQAEDSDDDDE